VSCDKLTYLYLPVFASGSWEAEKRHCSASSWPGKEGGQEDVHPGMSQAEAGFSWTGLDSFVHKQCYYLERVRGGSHGECLA